MVDTVGNRYNMVFNSFEFVVFFIAVLLVYHAINHRWQNRMLIVASYFFYGYWDWRFLSLILISTTVDYFCGARIYLASRPKAKKKYLILSIATNLGLLGFFKYFNFFVDSMAILLENVGMTVHLPTLQIVLPVGISFYTFQTMTYSIDIYRGKLRPTRRFDDFALFVAFFPQLVAGPIERAHNLLPQICQPRQFDHRRLSQGMQLIFWGMFKKIFVADNLAVIVNGVYGNPEATGVEYIIATWAFAFQIYGDFSGYSDIARGCAACLGINLMLNFRQPYFAVSPSDFWRHWHISLSSWLRDYLYIPLGGNRKGQRTTYRNLMITMVLGGLWHGAAWNFVLWGIFHGTILSLHRIVKGMGRGVRTADNTLGVLLLKCFGMFQLTCVGWILFRAQSLNEVATIFGSILSLGYNPTTCPKMLADLIWFAWLPLTVMGYMFLKEVRSHLFARYRLLKYLDLHEQPIVIRSSVYGVLVYLLCLYGASAQSFIYFQF